MFIYYYVIKRINSDIFFLYSAAKLPFPPYPLKIRGDQKSWLQKSIEEEVSTAIN